VFTWGGLQRRYLALDHKIIQVQPVDSRRVGGGERSTAERKRGGVLVSEIRGPNQPLLLHFRARPKCPPQVKARSPLALLNSVVLASAYSNRAIQSHGVPQVGSGFPHAKEDGALTSGMRSGGLVKYESPHALHIDLYNNLVANRFSSSSVYGVKGGSEIVHDPAPSSILLEHPTSAAHPPSIEVHLFRRETPSIA
jgi:hypothetical protein